MNTGYSDTVRRWATDSRRAGRVGDADGIGEVGLGAGEKGRNLAVRMSLRRADTRIAEVRYQVFGCGFLIAACAVAADMAEGATLDGALAIDADAIGRALGGLPPERAYCGDIAFRALRLAVESARDHTGTASERMETETHGPRVDANDPVYAALMASPAPTGVAAEDRHFHACLLAVAAREPEGTAKALGLSGRELAELRRAYFPTLAPETFVREGLGEAPEPDPEIMGILLSHVSPDRPESLRLARVLGARAARPGHLWVSMGLFARPELTTAIRRHLPTLAAANDKGMRWKKYLFKTLCDRSGALLCKAPNCGVCSDYALCFAPEGE